MIIPFNSFFRLFECLQIFQTPHALSSDPRSSPLRLELDLLHRIAIALRVRVRPRRAALAVAPRPAHAGPAEGPQHGRRLVERLVVRDAAPVRVLDARPAADLMHPTRTSVPCTSQCHFGRAPTRSRPGWRRGGHARRWGASAPRRSAAAGGPRAPAAPATPRGAAAAAPARGTGAAAAAVGAATAAGSGAWWAVERGRAGATPGLRSRGPADVLPGIRPRPRQRWPTRRGRKRGYIRRRPGDACRRRERDLRCQEGVS